MQCPNPQCNLIGTVMAKPGQANAYVCTHCGAQFEINLRAQGLAPNLVHNPVFNPSPSPTPKDTGYMPIGDTDTDSFGFPPIYALGNMNKTSEAVYALGNMDKTSEAVYALGNRMVLLHGKALLQDLAPHLLLDQLSMILEQIIRIIMHKRHFKQIMNL